MKEPNLGLPKCNHGDKLRIEVNYHAPDYEGGDKNTREIFLCKKCFEGVSRRCAWCGGSIYPGSLITLYQRDNNFIIPNYAIQHTDNSYLGCSREGCCESNKDITGFWGHDGKIHVLPPW